MVQVDIFWSFGWGATFAAFGMGELRNAEEPFYTKAFVKNLLFLALFFVPSGAWLLWSFPSWETMHVGTYETIPGWLVALFCMTNITQGILGFWVTYKLIRAKKEYEAALMVVLGWFLFSFVLFYGWDGTGYQRFFYVDRDWSGNIVPWVHGHFKLRYLFTFLFSPVAALLVVGFGSIMTLPTGYWLISLYNDSFKKQGLPWQKAMVLLGRIIAGYGMGSAIIAVVLISLLGWFIGLPAFLAYAYFIFRKGGLVNGRINKLFPPVEAAV